MKAFKKNQPLSFESEGMIVGSKLLKGISYQYFVRFCKHCKRHTIDKHIFDPATCFMIQHGIPIELSFSVKIQLKTPSGTLGGIKTHYKLDGPKTDAALYVLGKREKKTKLATEEK